jgi:homopolymeric O-antigen transport system permease protein
MIRFLREPFECAWHYRELIQVILWRELAARFRDSYVSWGWAVFAPLVMLTLYTLIFSTTLKISAAPEGGVRHYALRIFVGLIIFNLTTELISRAPTLMHEHAAFLKKSIFPSEMLIWIALLRALVYSGISLVVLLVFELALTGHIPATALLFPFLLAPFCCLLLGLTWFLAALGAFTRDVSYLIVSFVPVLLFTTPVFYSLQDLPDTLHKLAYFNPMTSYIEMSSQILLASTWPDPLVYVASTVASLCVFFAGRTFFVRYRNVIVDVI